VAVVLDVCHATDTPGIAHELHGETKLGKGPSVTHGTCNHPEVVKRLIKVAAKAKIPLQHESSSRYSGTDTDQIFHVREGIASGLVSLPLRYMHSVVETAHLRDVERVIDLLAGFVLSLKPGERFRTEI
jgi:putative aminopeptidase FrvX